MSVRLQAIEDAKREEFEKHQLELLRPDKAKLQDFANELRAINAPILESITAMSISGNAIALITKAFVLIETEIKKI